MSQQMNAKEVGRQAARARLALRSPVTQKRVKRKANVLAKRAAAQSEETPNKSRLPEVADTTSPLIIESRRVRIANFRRAPQIQSETEQGRPTSGTQKLPEGRDGTRSPPLMIAPDPQLGPLREEAPQDQLAGRTDKAKSKRRTKGKLMSRTRCIQPETLSNPVTPGGDTSEAHSVGGLLGHGQGQGGRGRGRTVKPKGNARGRGEQRKDRILLTPPGWVRPQLDFGSRGSPPILRQSTQQRRVMQNLLEAVHSASNAHGVERLIESERREEDIVLRGRSPPHGSSDLHQSDLEFRTRDCKEAPQVTPCNKGKGLAILDNSAAWYNSCDTDSCQSHGQGAIQDYLRSLGGVAPAIMASVLPHVLGLSPTSHGGSTMRGEVTREFTHAITGATTLLIDFGGVIGVRSVPKVSCEVEGTHLGGPSELPKGFRPCRQQLLRHFDAAEDSLEHLTPFLVGGDLELPPLSPPAEVEEENYSPTIGVSYPHYLLPLEDTGSDESNGDDEEEDPDWHARYADFACDSDADNSDWELDEPDVIDEVGPVEDVSLDECSFESRYANGHWDSLETTLLGNRDTFIGPQPGPTRRPTRRVVKLHEFFELFWPECDLQTICEETNRYAMQESVDHPRALNGRGMWKSLTVIELKAWLGVCILMGLKQQPTMRSFWSRQSFYGCPIIKRVMGRARFELILSCLHLVDNESLVQDKSVVGYDKIGKCRWLIESFVRKAKSAFNCEKHLACDEIMVPYKGRRCDIKQYMKNKPVKYGIKIWCCASTESRYVYNLIVYEGRKKQKSEKNLGMKVVLKLVNDLTHLGHVVVTDKFFTSPQLADALLSLGTWFTGTAMHNRVGMPSHLAQYVNAELPRGTIVAAMHRCRQMAACVWFDGCPVYLLSTSSNPLAPGCICLRWVGGERKPYTTSPMQVEYQDKMRGVDVVDQCRVEYSAQILSHKWWHRLLFFILDTSLGNAYVLYKAYYLSRDKKRRPRKPVTRAEFHYAIAAWLTAPMFSLGRTQGKFNLSGHGLHEPVSAGLQRRKCKLCGRKQNYYCPGCAGAFMCRRTCYHKVHTQAKFAASIWIP